MSDMLYNAKQYIRFEADEFIAMGVTALFAASALNMRTLLFTHFGEAVGLQSLAISFVFLLFIMIVAVYLCKIVALKLGILITYRAHYVGLLFFLAVTLMSAGFLPLFLPGGFVYSDNARLRIGKWPGNFRRGWETGLVTGTFPLAVLLFVLLLSPLYLYTQAELYANILIACCLIALYAMVPLPMLQHHGGAMKDWWRSLKDCTFGLDVLYSSKFWYAILVVTIVIFSALTIILTLVGVRVGILIYIISLALGFLCSYVYSKFFLHK